MADDLQKLKQAAINIERSISIGAKPSVSNLEALLDIYNELVEMGDAEAMLSRPWARLRLIYAKMGTEKPNRAVVASLTGNAKVEIIIIAKMGATELDLWIGGMKRIAKSKEELEVLRKLVGYKKGFDEVLKMLD